jgi:hypothetical protein
MFRSQTRCGLLVALLLCMPALPGQAEALGTGFTYQGHLVQNGVPATGLFDVRFLLLDGPDPATANILGSTTVPGVAVAAGLFSAQVDFGNVFSGDALWVEI